MHTYDDVARELVDRLVTRARPNVVASQKGGGGEWNSSVAIDHHAELIGACRRTMMQHACTYIYTDVSCLDVHTEVGEKKTHNATTNREGAGG